MDFCSTSHLPHQMWMNANAVCTVHGRIVRTPVLSTDVAHVTHPFFHTEQKVSPKLPSSHLRTPTPPQTHHRPMLQVLFATCRTLSFLLELALFTAWSVPTDTSDVNTPLWSMLEKVILFRAEGKTADVLVNRCHFLSGDQTPSRSAS